MPGDGSFDERLLCVAQAADYPTKTETKAGFERSEFAGAAFSKDGKTLFVNVQSAGVTLAIWGDWGKFKS